MSSKVEAKAAKLQALIAEAVRTAKGLGTKLDAAMTVPRRTGPPLTILVSPAPMHDWFGLGVPVALVLIKDPAAPAGSAAVLRQLFNLTAREAELALALVEGRTETEFAAMRGISHNTAHAHMKNLMTKTGCRRQSELVALLLKSAAGLTPHATENQRGA